jgi:CHAT domain-containing protein
LIAPVRPLLDCKHLIVVPHDFLHYLPFHALWDGEAHLCDSYTISYAPSASVFQLCSVKKAAASDRSLVLGIPDMHAPDIAKEAACVAEAVAPASLYVGEEATEEVLKREAPGCRFVHIATHGFFRQDNPMFSAVRLGSSDLSLFDLYQLDLSAELVTLSGCGTGMNVIVGGDELLGLCRGLLYAGAQTVMASLWEVNDRSTATFMANFYSRLAKGEAKALALQHSMQDLREEYPHPYYWAPFVIIGKPS